MVSWYVTVTLILLPLCLASVPASAGNSTSSSEEYVSRKEMDGALEALDTAWKLFAGFLVFSMQVGFAFLEAGGVRAVNVVTIIFKNLGDCCLGALVFIFLGSQLMEGSGDAWTDRVMGYPTGTKYMQILGVCSDVRVLRKIFIEYCYLATASTIISGSVAERIRMEAYYILTLVVCGLSYPLGVHWIREEAGFLYRLGVIDFAGSLVVHMSSGVFAFFAAMVLGKRILPGNIDPLSDQGQEFTSPQNKFLQAIGALFLWFGWLGFNTGLLKVSTQSHIAVRAVLCTTFAGASAAVVGILGTQLKYGHLELSETINALLAGLVSVSASCGFIAVGWSIVIGAVGGAVYFLGRYLRIRAGVDDVIDASAVHGAAGLWGSLAAAIFASESLVQEAYPGRFDSGFDRGRQVGMQLVGVLSIFVLNTVAGVTSCLILSRLKLLRVSSDDETLGLDRSQLKLPYPIDFVGDAVQEPPMPIEGIVVDEPLFLCVKKDRQSKICGISLVDTKQLSHLSQTSTSCTSSLEGHPLARSDRSSLRSRRSHTVGHEGVVVDMKAGSSLAGDDTTYDSLTRFQEDFRSRLSTSRSSLRSKNDPNTELACEEVGVKTEGMNYYNDEDGQADDPTCRTYPPRREPMIRFTHPSHDDEHESAAEVVPQSENSLQYSGCTSSVAEYGQCSEPILRTSESVENDPTCHTYPPRRELCNPMIRVVHPNTHDKECENLEELPGRPSLETHQYPGQNPDPVKRNSEPVELKDKQSKMPILNEQCVECTGRYFITKRAEKGVPCIACAGCSRQYHIIKEDKVHQTRCPVYQRHGFCHQQRCAYFHLCPKNVGQPSTQKE